MSHSGRLVRTDMLAACQSGEVWDMVVIGGGATGLGTALDAASRGYRTVLLEAVDFAKGTSSRSTKLVHGGVRYLRSGQVGMVRESLHERGRLLRNAPHLVHPMRFVIPVYQFGKRWYYYAGMKAYDLLAGQLGMEPARMLSSQQTQELLPTLNAQGLRGGVLYSDGQFDDARLTVALAKTCADQGGVVLNYAPVIGLTKQGSRVSGVVFRDEQHGTEVEVRAKVVINATGVFGGDVMEMDQEETSQRPNIVPSQGTHLVLDRSFLPSDNALMIPDTDDGRVLFAIPWYGHSLIGTTDNLVKQILPEPQPQSAEIDYLLAHAGRYLSKQPTRADVRSVFAGLRPLVGQSGKSQSTASLSREHEIHTSASGLITIIGGKWTTYRKMGEDVVNLASRQNELPKSESRTANMKLHGLEDQLKVGDANNPLSVFQADAHELTALVQERPDLEQRLHANLPYQRVHCLLAARSEMACTVEDVLARRTRSLLFDASAACECSQQVAQLLAEELGRDEGWVEEQVAAFHSTAQTYLV